MLKYVAACSLKNENIHNFLRLMSKALMVPKKPAFSVKKNEQKMLKYVTAFSLKNENIY